MNKYSLLFLCLLAFVLATGGCTTAPREKLSDPNAAGAGFDTVSYEFKTITRDDPDCDSADKKACRIINIRYQVFDGHPALNDSVNRKLLAVYPFEETPLPSKTTIEEQADRFMKQYEEFKKEPYSAGRRYELTSSTETLTESQNLLTLQLDAYTYSGGAHGASFRSFINYDIAQKKVLLLNDILKNNYRDSLLQVAERVFRKNEGLAQQGPLPKDAYFFKGNKFDLSNAYAFTPQGILFLYNEYEIKPYAAGRTELLVKYGLLKNLLRPGTVLDQFQK